ncbi:MAG: hypothetical protein A3F35_03545 [Candidatus Woykebacteria bacterium RIFCSPHIGHO2_12_FULL_45_10]|uniref:Beta-lactamase class A catalytic domain-containing protein n=1 Tax=Candidatus Woykebacteria bacterium RIFCSPHIGHO2_12_FULL_45_10 TaxID=1802603 RepID=A0A1G1WRY3_9BACT|nr:MAG: hypothetical protein A3F35_03545 [Candidatus Woykebacteria bacterium RIFCSPHIGHO2_12_FULL_45_10]
MINESYLYRRKKESFFLSFFRFLRKSTKIALLLIIIGGSLLVSYQMFKGEAGVKTPLVSSNQIEGWTTTTKKQPPPPKRTADEAKRAALLAKLNPILKVNSQYSVSVIDLGIGDSFGINETEQFHAASLMKVLVATAVFEEIERGKLSLSTQLGSYDVQFQLKQMINQSNNTSWDYFNNLLGWDREQETATRFELSGTRIWGNLMTTADAAKLLKLHEDGAAIAEVHRDLLFSYMQNTETEDRITPVIPAEVKVYHKTGTFEAGIHDAAIVKHPRNPFILVVFTNGGATNQIRIKSIQDAAREVYAYFDSL